MRSFAKTDRFSPTPDFFPETGNPALPPGFRYGTEFVSRDEEAALVREIEGLKLAPYEFRGVLARRRVVAFGYQHDYRTRKLDHAPEIPGFLLPLQRRVADFVGVAVEHFRQALVSEYSPGTPIGWHVDRAHYETIVGVSLLSAATLRLRRQEERGWRRVAQPIEARSVYVMRGEARALWQHSIPAVAALRYSITFRTMTADKAAER